MPTCSTLPSLRGIPSPTTTLAGSKYRSWVNANVYCTSHILGGSFRPQGLGTWAASHTHAASARGRSLLLQHYSYLLHDTCRHPILAIAFDAFFINSHTKLHPTSRLWFLQPRFFMFKPCLPWVVLHLFISCLQRWHFTSSIWYMLYIQRPITQCKLTLLCLEVGIGM